MKWFTLLACLTVLGLVGCDNERGTTGGGTQVDEAVSNTDRVPNSGMEKRPGEPNAMTPSPSPSATPVSVQ